MYGIPCRGHIRDAAHLRESGYLRQAGLLELTGLVLPLVLGREYWGHGYATEAGRAVLAYGFGELGVARVLSPINSANGRSIRLAQRLGCCIRRNLHPRPSPYHDTPYVYAVLERTRWSEWCEAAATQDAG